MGCEEGRDKKRGANAGSRRKGGRGDGTEAPIAGVHRKKEGRGASQKKRSGARAQGAAESGCRCAGSLLPSISACASQVARRASCNGQVRRGPCARARKEPAARTQQNDHRTHRPRGRAAASRRRRMRRPETRYDAYDVVHIHTTCAADTRHAARVLRCSWTRTQTHAVVEGGRTCLFQRGSWPHVMRLEHGRRPRVGPLAAARQ